MSGFSRSHKVLHLFLYSIFTSLTSPIWNEWNLSKPFHPCLVCLSLSLRNRRIGWRRMENIFFVHQVEKAVFCHNMLSLWLAVCCTCHRNINKDRRSDLWLTSTCCRTFRCVSCTAYRWDGNKTEKKRCLKWCAVLTGELDWCRSLNLANKLRFGLSSSR